METLWYVPRFVTEETLSLYYVVNINGPQQIPHHASNVGSSRHEIRVTWRPYGQKTLHMCWNCCDFEEIYLVYGWFFTIVLFRYKMEWIKNHVIKLIQSFVKYVQYKTQIAETMICKKCWRVCLEYWKTITFPGSYTLREVKVQDNS